LKDDITGDKTMNARRPATWQLAALAWGLAVAAFGAQAQPASEAEALHVLNRLAYGPRPGDLQHVMDIGIDRYVDEQLHPERIAQPAALNQELAALSTLTQSQRELVEQFREAEKAARNGGEQGKDMRRELVQRIAQEAAEARLRRAIESPRQLEEVMVDFWFNHFNIYEAKGLDRALVANYEREAIRPYAMGRFRDLLGATAHHPAMLFYLDNWLSTGPEFHAKAKGPAAKANGLNENYARELMELHTLGVDGGYTQQDVTELARMLTGWTFDPRRGFGSGSLFVFDGRRHDHGVKHWLGETIADRGQDEGEHALDVLARHPATAHHIAFQLAQYFVADAPPPALVDELAKRFLDTDGDIRAVLKALFDSREFRDPAAQQAKFKTPYQFLVSAVRAAGVDPAATKPLAGGLHQLGMPLYGCVTPDGYKNTEEAWLNPDAITRRVNFATAFAAGKTPVSTQPLDAGALLATLGSTISARTRAEVVRVEGPLQPALVLGSPDFMRR
jgi:uncharacterized protein (DUF1800 family)